MRKTVGKIKRELADTGKQDNLYSRIFYRKLSPYLTYLFLKMGISAGTVTWLSVAMAFIGCFLISFSDMKVTVLGFIFLQLWYLLDHVDGEIARYTKTTSKEGMYLDFATHSLVHPIIYFGFAMDAINNVPVLAHFTFFSLALPFRRLMLFFGFLTAVSVMTIDLASSLRYTVILAKAKWQKTSGDYMQTVIRLKNSSAIKPNTFYYKLWHYVGWNIFCLPGAVWVLTLGSLLSINRFFIPIFALVTFPLTVYSIIVREKNGIDTVS